MARHRGHMFYICLYWKIEKIFLSETTRPRFLIFGIYLVDLYQVYTNYAPGAKMAPPKVPHVLHRLI